MGYCRKYGTMVTVCDCLGCKDCRPPAAVSEGDMRAGTIIAK